MILSHQILSTIRLLDAGKNTIFMFIPFACSVLVYLTYTSVELFTMFCVSRTTHIIVHSNKALKKPLSYCEFYEGVHGLANTMRNRAEFSYLKQPNVLQAKGHLLS